VQADSSDGEDEARGGAKGENGMDMQVTFDSGLETLGERLASKKGSKAAQTLWEAYEKRRRCLQAPFMCSMQVVFAMAFLSWVSGERCNATEIR